MLHGIDITLVQYAGMRKGLWKTEPLDVIVAERGGKRRRIGYVARAENATVLLTRYLRPEVREPIRKKVERLRMESGGYSISSRVSCVPDPNLIKAYVKGDLKKAAPTTVEVPEGVPEESDDE